MTQKKLSTKALAEALKPYRRYNKGILFRKNSDLEIDITTHKDRTKQNIRLHWWPLRATVPRGRDTSTEVHRISMYILADIDYEKRISTLKRGIQINAGTIKCIGNSFYYVYPLDSANLDVKNNFPNTKEWRQFTHHAHSRHKTISIYGDGFEPIEFLNVSRSLNLFPDTTYAFIYLGNLPSHFTKIWESLSPSENINCSFFTKNGKERIRIKVGFGLAEKKEPSSTAYLDLLEPELNHKENYKDKTADLHLDL